MTGSDVAGLISAINSKDRDGYGFGENWIWIIGLLIVAGIFGGGFGWGNNRNNASEVNIDTRFLERDIFNTNQNVSTTGCQTQRDVLESRYTTQLGLQQLQASQQNCCCDTQKEILQNRYDNALQTQTLSSQMAQCLSNFLLAIKSLFTKVNAVGTYA